MFLELPTYIDIEFEGAQAIVVRSSVRSIAVDRRHSVDVRLADQVDVDMNILRYQLQLHVAEWPTGELGLSSKGRR